MADFTVTAANVLASTAASKTTGTAGATITAGDTLARDDDGTIKLHDANAATPLNSCKGVALHASLAGQPITYATRDPNFQPGYSGMVAGDAIICSANPGKSCPDTDKATGWWVTELGRAIDATHYKLAIVETGVVR
jgi:hypothetical protein